MNKRQVMNVITFIRGVEPRYEFDLMESVKEQIALLKTHKLKATFLLQYDALINPAYSDLLRSLDPEQFEVGVWFEVVEPMVKKAGIPWTGRFAWDWHPHCGFSVGYPKEQREALVRILFEDFKSIMGYYPRSFGSWAFDVHTLRYIEEHYGLDAACICRDQWGTDGYNLWGGYYGQAYYPNRHNMFAPAQTRDEQIQIPLFRMLGSDMIQQYDLGLDPEIGVQSQGVATLEPYYKRDCGGGGLPAWVDWFFEQNYNGKCLTFGYAHAGQENSFSWKWIEDGLRYQFAKIAEWQAKGKLSVETLSETGRAYKQSYDMTPASTLVAEDDWKGSGKASVWYSCKNYRVNLYGEQKRFWIRDLQLFREGYEERYETETAPGTSLTFDNLPVVDGVRFTGDGVRAGLYPNLPNGTDGTGLPYTEMHWEELTGEVGACRVTFTDTPCGELRVTLRESGIEIDADHDFSLLPRTGSVAGKLITSAAVDSKRVTLTYRGYSYGITVTSGQIAEDFRLTSENRTVALALDS